MKDEIIHLNEIFNQNFRYVLVHLTTDISEDKILMKYNYQNLEIRKIFSPFKLPNRAVMKNSQEDSG